VKEFRTSRMVSIAYHEQRHSKILVQ